MTLLIISPDYASHLLPLATLGTAWRDAGERVVVATGPATRSIVDGFGYEWVELRLGRGSNPGTIRAEEQPKGEDDALRGFFDATERGMVETLAYQAHARLDDLLWAPLETALAVRAVVEAVGPDQVIVDHLAFTARLALVAAGVGHADVVLGHPSALPVGDEVYGFPPAWPAVFTPSAESLAGLRAECDRVRDSFTAEWNAALAQLDPAAQPVTDAFAEAGDLLLLNYPELLVDPARRALLPPHAFLGSAVRSEPADAEVEQWLAAGDPDAPIVYVSFGSFLSVRADVLSRVVDALDGLQHEGRAIRVALATGSADPEVLGTLPSEWLARGFLPQVHLLEHAAVAVSHGGNNSVTEAMTAGVPLVVLPFSTDQFAGAAALDEHGFGVSLDPNAATPAELRAAVERMLALPAPVRTELDTLAAALTSTPGAARARRALLPLPPVE